MSAVRKCEMARPGPTRSSQAPCMSTSHTPCGMTGSAFIKIDGMCRNIKGICTHQKARVFVCVCNDVEVSARVLSKNGCARPHTRDGALGSGIGSEQASGKNAAKCLARAECNGWIRTAYSHAPQEPQTRTFPSPEVNLLAVSRAPMSDCAFAGEGTQGGRKRGGGGGGK